MNTFEAIHGGENHRLWIGGHRGHASATRENTTANFAEVWVWAWITSRSTCSSRATGRP
ncbi:MAG: hypothetical protein ACLUI3_07100 [Christensenellales bacterium]